MCLPCVFKLELEVSVAFSFQVFFFSFPVSAPGVEKQFEDYNDNVVFLKAESTRRTILYRRLGFGVYCTEGLSFLLSLID